MSVRDDLAREFASTVRNLEDYGFSSVSVECLGGNVFGIVCKLDPSLDTSTHIVVSNGTLGHFVDGVDWSVSVFDEDDGETSRVVHVSGGSWWHLQLALEAVWWPNRPIEFNACSTGRLVVVHRQYFTDDDVHDGAIDYSRESFEIHPDVTPMDAVKLVRDEGLSFETYSSDVAYDPDGSRVVDYGTGERCQAAAYFRGFSPLVFGVIRNRVG